MYIQNIASRFKQFMDSHKTAREYPWTSDYSASRLMVIGYTNYDLS